MKFPKKDLLLIGAILLISFFTWRHIPSMQFVGESWGFIGKPYIKGNFFQIAKEEFTPLNEFTIDRILSAILIPEFGDQIHLYMWFQFIYMLITDVLVYILVRLITGSKLTGFLAAFFYSTSFIAKFETYSSGGFLYFAQRATLVVSELVAIFFLYLYLVKRFNPIYYLFSLGSYIFSLAMCFYGTFFVPIFIIYPVVYLLFNFRKNVKLLWKVIWVPFPFIISTLLIIRGSRAFTSESIFEFVINKFPYVVTGIIQQLTVLTFPVGELLPSSDKLSFEYYAVLCAVVILYGLALCIPYKKNKQWIIFQVTAILTVAAMLLFNVNLQAAEVLNTNGSSRYFYFPFIFVAIFWGIFLGGLIRKKNKFISAGIIILCVGYFIFNNVYIQKRLRAEEWIHKANKETVEILRSYSYETRSVPSYIYLPASIGAYGGEFVIQFYSHKDGQVAVEGLEPLDLEKLADSNLSPKNLYVLHFDSGSNKVIDKTKEARDALGELQKRK